jgi:hypothetical protein
VANGLWEVQNRARALDNTCYVVAPNVACYYLTQESDTAIDTFGGQSMIVDYQGRVLSEHKYGSGSSYAGAIIDVEALRQYRTRSLWGNWIKDLRTEQYRLIYDREIYPRNLCLVEPPRRHAENDVIVRAQIEKMVEKGIWKRPSMARAEKEEKVKERISAD